jgi:hypothetical protein
MLLLTPIFSGNEFQRQMSITFGGNYVAAESSSVIFSAFFLAVENSTDLFSVVFS